jgi:hypothetical protein
MSGGLLAGPAGGYCQVQERRPKQSMECVTPSERFYILGTNSRIHRSSVITRKSQPVNQIAE